MIQTPISNVSLSSSLITKNLMLSPTGLPPTYYEVRCPCCVRSVFSYSTPETNLCVLDHNGTHGRPLPQPPTCLVHFNPSYPTLIGPSVPYNTSKSSFCFYINRDLKSSSWWSLHLLPCRTLPRISKSFINDGKWVHGRRPARVIPPTCLLSDGLLRRVLSFCHSHFCPFSQDPIKPVF